MGQGRQILFYQQNFFEEIVLIANGEYADDIDIKKGYCIIFIIWQFKCFTGYMVG